MTQPIDRTTQPPFDATTKKRIHERYQSLFTYCPILLKSHPTLSDLIVNSLLLNLTMSKNKNILEDSVRKHVEKSPLKKYFVLLFKSFNEGWDKLEEMSIELEKKKRGLAEKNGGLDVHDDDVLIINVGRRRVFRIERKLLTHIEDSALAGLFSGRWENKLQRDCVGRIFVDINHECFGVVMDYLGALSGCPANCLPNTRDFIDISRENKQFFACLFDVFGVCPTFPVPDSAILLQHGSRIESLQRFLNGDEPAPARLSLLYRGTRDGMNAAAFHSKCDNQGPTITIVRSGDNIFGGFTDRSWDCSNATKQTGRSFLFGLRCESSRTPFKAPMTIHDIVCREDEGPRFGDNLSIFDSRLGGSFCSAFTIFAGSTDFQPSEVEVFKVGECNATAQKEMTRYDGISDSALMNIFADHQKCLAIAFDEHQRLEDKFKKEQAVAKIFCAQEGDEIIYLNVKGTHMAVKQSTLATYPNSVLYKHFVDPKWNHGFSLSQQGSLPQFIEVEQDAYCFEKLIDHMRWKVVTNSNSPTDDRVWTAMRPGFSRSDPDKLSFKPAEERQFREMVDYYFPTTKEDFLGRLVEAAVIEQPRLLDGLVIFGDSDDEDSESHASSDEELEAVVVDSDDEDI